MVLQLKNYLDSKPLAERFVIADTIGEHSIAKFSDGVWRIEGKKTFLFARGRYNIVFKKDDCKDVTAELIVSNTVVLSNVSGGEMAIEDNAVSCDMECE